MNMCLNHMHLVFVDNNKVNRLRLLSKFDWEERSGEQVHISDINLWRNMMHN